MGELQDITTSVYTFSNLITGGFVYVDKPAYLCELMRPKFAQYFCAEVRLCLRVQDPRKVFKIGCAFDWERRNLGPWLVA